MKEVGERAMKGGSERAMNSEMYVFDHSKV